MKPTVFYKLIWLVSALFLTVNDPNTAIASSQGQKPDLRSEDSGSRLFIIFTLSQMTCPCCFKTFHAFHDTLKVHGFEKSVCGIMTLLNEETDQRIRDTQNRILKKQLRGFVRANRIDFPILADTQSVFSTLCTTGSILIMFDRLFGVIRHWEFPLTGSEMAELIALISMEP